MKLKILMIINPNAGRNKRTKCYDEIIKNLQNQNYEVNACYTTKEYNATHIVQNYELDYDIVIVCGGDGTLNEVMQALFEKNKQVFIGFIPFGTTNDFAKSLGVSFDKLHLSKNINQYDSTKIDLCLFNQRVFNYTASFGLFSKTSYLVSYKMKNKYGKLAYWLSGIKEVFTCKSYKLKFQYEEQEIEEDFFYGSISNSSYIGGFPVFKKKDISLNDGLFEVVLVKKPKNIFHLLYLLIKITNGNFKDKNIYYFQSSELQIESLSECEWSIDGEYGSSCEKIHIMNLEKFSQYLIPTNE